MRRCRTSTTTCRRRASPRCPIEPRDAARLLVDRGDTCPPEHRTSPTFPTLLRPGDLARRQRHPGDPGPAAAAPRHRRQRSRCCCSTPAGRGGAMGGAGAAGAAAQRRRGAAIGASRRATRSRSRSANGWTTPVVGACGCSRTTRSRALDRHGEMPLPPYIHAPLADPERYQTVYAPTAGLGRPRRPPACTSRRACSHALPGQRHRRRTVELVVGLDTFQPVTADDPSDHRMHSERYRVPAADAGRVRGAPSGSSPSARRRCGRSSRAATGPLSAGRTDLFIHRGVRLAGRRRAADQLPPAALDAADDDRRVRRAALARPLRHRAGRGLPLPVVRRRDAARPRTRRADDPVTLRRRGDRRRGARRRRRARPAARYRTPCFMPVGTRGAVKYLTAADLRGARRRDRARPTPTT